MDMIGEESPIDPAALLSDERLKYAVTILQRAQDERPPARERLVALAQELDRLLGEIELFGRVVYCGQAAACLLDNGVVRVLAGSVIAQGQEQQKTLTDCFWNRPSPAASSVLGRSANGWKEWKDRRGRPIKE